MLRTLLLVFLLGGAVAFSHAATAREGIELLRQGRYREAIAPLEAARKSAPGDPDLQRALTAAYLGAGVELLRGGDLDRALAMFRAGEELAPGDSQFSLYRGILLLKQGDAAGAEAAFAAGLRKTPPSAKVYRLLADAYYEAGRLPETQAYLEKALKLAPEGKEDRALLEKVRRERKVEGKMTTHQGKHFSISYVEGGKLLGAQTLQVLQQAYVELGKRFDSYPARPVAVIIYGRKDFFAATGAPDWAEGVYDGKIRVPVGGLQEMNDDLRRALYHEYAHVLIMQLTRGNIPHWLNEGLAQVAEGRLPKEQLTLLQKSRKTLRPVPFSRLESFEGLSGGKADDAYLQSRDFVAFLLERYGWTRMVGLLKALGEGNKFEEAVGQFLLYPGEDFRKVEGDWRERKG